MKNREVIHYPVNLKKSIFVLLLLTGITYSGYSQLFIGPVVGPQVNRLQFFEPKPKKEFRSLPAPGFFGGVMASMKVRNKFYLTGSLLYSQKGKLTKGKEDPRYKNFLNLHYIDVPIYYTLEFTQKTPGSTGKGGMVRAYKWFVGAGPTISYWLGGKGKLSSSNLKENEIDVLKYKVTFNQANGDLTAENDGDKMNIETPNRFQFGINFTGGIAFEPVGLHKIIVAGHLELGQTFLSKESKGYFPINFIDVDVLKGKYQGFRLSMAYLIDTKISEKNKGKSTDKEMKRIRKKRR